jgi:predicted nucleic acid-binding protein
MTLVDTSSWIHFLRRKGDTTVKKRVGVLLQQGEAVTCPMVLVELWMGAGSEKDRSDVAKIEAVLQNLQMTQVVWQMANRLASMCREAGTPVPGTDVVIAACAHVHGAAIEAVDAHFPVLHSLSHRL